MLTISQINFKYECLDFLAVPQIVPFIVLMNCKKKYTV